MTASDVMALSPNRQKISPRDENKKNSPEARNGAARAVTAVSAVAVNFIFSLEQSKQATVMMGSKRTSGRVDGGGERRQSASQRFVRHSPLVVNMMGSPYKIAPLCPIVNPAPPHLHYPLSTGHWLSLRWCALIRLGCIGGVTHRSYLHSSRLYININFEVLVPT